MRKHVCDNRTVKIGDRLKSSMDTHIYNLQIRVLIYREDEECVARALEMDLLGYGKSEVEAVEELKRTIEAQLSFAHQMNDASLIGFPAKGDFFKRWDDAQQKALRSEILGDRSVKLEARAVVITFTPSELRVLRSRKFRSKEMVCA